jgi:hypothetical protein
MAAHTEAHPRPRGVAVRSGRAGWPSAGRSSIKEPPLLPKIEEENVHPSWYKIFIPDTPRGRLMRQLAVKHNLEMKGDSFIYPEDVDHPFRVEYRELTEE